MEPTEKPAKPSAEEIEMRLSRVARLADRVKELVRDVRSPPTPDRPDASNEDSSNENPGEAQNAGSAPVAEETASAMAPDPEPVRSAAEDELSMQIFVTRQNIIRLASLANSRLHDPHQISRMLNGEVARLCQLLGQDSVSSLVSLPPREAEGQGAGLQQSQS